MKAKSMDILHRVTIMDEKKVSVGDKPHNMVEK
jgi:hypothetical protein